MSDAVAVDAPGEATSTNHQVGIVHLFLTTIPTTCLGFVGAQNNEFCTNNIFDCSRYKDQDSHFNNRLKSLPSHFYICKNKAGSSAWCNYAIPVYNLEIPGTCIQLKTSIESWKDLFDLTKEHHTLKDIINHKIERKLHQLTSTPYTKTLKTPW